MERALFTPQRNAALAKSLSAGNDGRQQLEAAGDFTSVTLVGGEDRNALRRYRYRVVCAHDVLIVTIGLRGDGKIAALGFRPESGVRAARPRRAQGLP